jgi:two-component system LytT family sensor kinase
MRLTNAMCIGKACIGINYSSLLQPLNIFDSYSFINMRSEFKKKGYIEVLLHTIVWGSLFLFMWYNAYTLGPFRKQDGTIYLPLIWDTVLSLVLFYANALYLVPRFISRQQFKQYILAALFLYAIIVLLNTVLDQQYSLSLFSSEHEPFFADLFLNVQSKILILSLSLGYALTRQWIINERLQQEMDKNKLRNELKYLKAQINPHFLFNTLNMAYASATKSNDVTTADIIEKLSGLMRYVLYESNEDKVCLAKEIEYIDNTVNLQIQRLSPELAAQVEYRVKGDWQNRKIAPLILIPFIENVFKHGIVVSKKGEMYISIFLESQTLILETRNVKSSRPSSAPAENSGIGLKNAKERLQLLYPNQHKLLIDETEPDFRVRLEVKIN